MVCSPATRKRPDERGEAAVPVEAVWLAVVGAWLKTKEEQEARVWIVQEAGVSPLLMAALVGYKSDDLSLSLFSHSTVVSQIPPKKTENKSEVPYEGGKYCN